jgi:hypothetical protein
MKPSACAFQGACVKGVRNGRRRRCRIHGDASRKF